MPNELINKDVSIFNNPSFGEIRVVIVDGEPWFVAKDIADILCYSETNRMTSRLDEDEVISTKLVGMNMTSILINESGLYNAVLGSNKPEAKTFKKWITSEVLPSIRKTGSYSLPKKNSPSLSEPEQTLKLSQLAWQALNVNDNSKLLLTHKLFNHYSLPTVALPVYTPSVDVLKSVTELLKLNNQTISAVKFNKILELNGILELKTRPSSKTPNKIKEFWSVTESGKEFGENQVSPHNPKETQPLFYEHKFKDLLKKVEQPNLF